jgi:hypothetical protein
MKKTQSFLSKRPNFLIEGCSPQKLASNCGSKCETDSSLTISIARSRACSSRHDGEEPLGTGIPNGQYELYEPDSPIQKLKSGVYDLCLKD